MNTHRLCLPLSEEKVHTLRVGDQVYLSGEIVITAGIPTHQRIMDFIEQGKALPVDLQGGSLLHLGGYNQEQNGHLEVLYINPTTSTRFNAYMPEIIRSLKLKVTGGKGGLDSESARAMQEVGCIYLSFIGGACALLSEAIREVISVDWNDFICHYRLIRLRVDNLGPATVGIDAKGNSLYEAIKDQASNRLFKS